MSGDSEIWLDGVLSSALPLPDRGLDFGDGLFETLLLRADQPLYLDLHLARLQRGCQALSLPDCLAAVRDQLQHAAGYVSGRGWAFTAIRVTLSRGAGPRGYAPPELATPRIIISATRLGDDHLRQARPAVLTLAKIPWPIQPALAGLKHLNRLEQVLAAREYREAGADEAVMLDLEGRAISVVAGNLYIVAGGTLLTAPLKDCGIAGTRRELLMRRWAPAIGLAVKEQYFTQRELEQADEAFYSNSLVGVRAIGGFGQRRWSSHATCDALYLQYMGSME